jgi:hypothetical protein
VKGDIAMSRQHPIKTRGVEPSIVDLAFVEAIEVVTELFVDAFKRCARPAQFLRAEDALAVLPLSTNEFALATRRLDNAFNYYHDAEFGACMYELWLLVRRIRNRSGIHLT